MVNLPYAHRAKGFGVHIVKIIPKGDKMKTELQNKLYDKYPKIFQQKDLDMTKTCMCWGIETDDGWYWLLNQLCGNIQSYIDSNKHLNIEQVEATQVKEKFGSLNFYCQGGDETIGGMICLAESMSYSICEHCGSTENIKQTKGWIKTLCKECME